MLTSYPLNKDTIARPTVIQRKKHTGYENRFISLFDDDVTLADGTQGKYARVTMKPGMGGVVIPRYVFRGIPYFGVVKQYRYAIERETIEFPRGGTADGTPVEALRELSEETGAQSLKTDKIGTIFADTGILTNEITVWLGGIDLKSVDHSFVERETGAAPVWVSQPRLEAWISSGKIVCGITLASWALYKTSSFASVGNEFL